MSCAASPVTWPARSPRGPPQSPGSRGPLGARARGRARAPATAAAGGLPGQYTVRVALPMGILFEEVEGYIFVGGVKPGSNASKAKVKIGTGDALLGYTDRRGRTQATAGRSLDEVLDELVECEGEATLVFAGADDMRDEAGAAGAAGAGPEAVEVVVSEKGGLMGPKRRTVRAARRSA